MNAQSNLSIIDPELVKIEIAIIADRRLPGLRLTYQARSYDLMRVFATNHLDLAQQRFQEAIANQNASAILALDEYLIVREVGYYSLWKLDRSTRQDAIVNLCNRPHQFSPSVGTGAIITNSGSVSSSQGSASEF